MVTTAQQQRIAISLSREELYIIMRLIKATNMPGFDLNWLKAAPDGTIPDETRYALEVATNALIARGYLTPEKMSATGSAKINMPAPVISLVGTCAFGEDSILLSLHTSSGPNLMYLHELRGLGVVHTMPLPDVHQFEAVNGRTDILRIIGEVLELRTQKVIALPAAKALAVDVQAARDAAIGGNVEDAVKFLIRGGLSVATAETLAEAMHEATVLGAIVIMKRGTDGTAHEATLALVITPRVCFALSDEKGTHPAAFHVQPTSAEALRQWIISLLP